MHLGRLRDKSRKVLEVSEILDYQDGEILVSPLYRSKRQEKRMGKFRELGEKWMTWFIHRSYWQQDIKKCEYVKMILKVIIIVTRNGMDILSLMGGSYIVDSGRRVVLHTASGRMH